LASENFSVERALASSNGVAEGYYTARAARELSSRYGLEAPILTGVYRVLYEGLNCREMLIELLSQDIAIE
jgi:glycerol-3-phosphate dehydrogenase (NAD(P)+)